MTAHKRNLNPTLLHICTTHSLYSWLVQPETESLFVISTNPNCTLNIQSCDIISTPSASRGKKTYPNTGCQKLTRTLHHPRHPSLPNSSLRVLFQRIRRYNPRIPLLSTLYFSKLPPLIIPSTVSFATTYLDPSGSVCFLCWKKFVFTMPVITRMTFTTKGAISWRKKSLKWLVGSTLTNATIIDKKIWRPSSGSFYTLHSFCNGAWTCGIKWKSHHSHIFEMRNTL